MVKYYAILRGRKNRYITKDYHECLSLVHGYPGAEYKSFKFWKEAAMYLDYALDPDKEYSSYNETKRKKGVLIQPVSFIGKVSTRL